MTGLFGIDPPAIDVRVLQTRQLHQICIAWIGNDVVRHVQRLPNNHIWVDGTNRANTFGVSQSAVVSCGNCLIHVLYSGSVNSRHVAEPGETPRFVEGDPLINAVGVSLGKIGGVNGKTIGGVAVSPTTFILQSLR